MDDGPGATPRVPALVERFAAMGAAIDGAIADDPAAVRARSFPSEDRACSMTPPAAAKDASASARTQ